MAILLFLVGWLVLGALGVIFACWASAENITGKNLGLCVVTTLLGPAIWPFIGAIWLAIWFDSLPPDYVYIRLTKKKPAKTTPTESGPSDMSPV